MGSKRASGIDKLERAFWARLEKTAYDRMTVSEVVREAGVNRALFYYHFDSLASLAEYAVVRAVPLEIAHSILARDLDAAEIVLRIVETSDVDERIRKLKLVAGPHGTVALVEVVKDAIRREWLRAYGIDEKNVDDSTHMAMSFVLGGITSMWADERFENARAFREAMMRSGVAPMAIAMLRRRLSELARSQTRS